MNVSSKRVNCTTGNAFQSKSTIERAWDQNKDTMGDKGSPTYPLIFATATGRTFVGRLPTKPKRRPALCHCCRVPDSPNHSQLDQEPQGRCRVNHSAALCRRCRKSAGVEHLGQLSLREVGEVVAFLAPPPVTNSQPRARNSVPVTPHWPSGRLMGFLFCRGLKFRPRVQVFREALNHERLPRTATHTLAARVAHTRGRACRLRCAGWIDSRRGVGSAQKSEIFSCGLDRRAVIRPSTTALSLSQCLHVAPRLTRC